MCARIGEHLGRATAPSRYGVHNNSFQIVAGYPCMRPSLGHGASERSASLSWLARRCDSRGWRAALPACAAALKECGVLRLTHAQRSNGSETRTASAPHPALSTAFSRDAAFVRAS
eukprot:1751223-Pleurochrysis_carterae.AAC.5